MLSILEQNLCFTEEVAYILATLVASFEAGGKLQNHTSTIHAQTHTHTHTLVTHTSNILYNYTKVAKYQIHGIEVALTNRN